ncbi:MAG: hypothetical protein KDD11_23120 [Acidobacteria bacterium]|nr:hypothetical protein [Acidobacteriota bacterium]
MKRFVLWLSLVVVGCVWSEVPAWSKPFKVDVLARGSVTRGANGMRFDSHDHLYVASFLGREILVLDPDRGRVLDRIPRPFETPDDLAFGPDGSLYWTSLLTGVVAHRTPDGGVTTEPVGISPNSVAVSADGHVYVGECLGAGGSGLYELDPDLAAPPRLITDALGVGCSVNGMDVAADGWLYGPRWFAGDIVRIDPADGAFEVVATGFTTPGAAKLGPDGALYVVDYGNGEVVRVDLGTGDRRVLAQLRPGIDNLAFDSRGHLFVSHAVDSEIVEIRSGGSVRVVSPGGMIAPGGLAVTETTAGEESLWVADAYDLTELDPCGGEVGDVELTGQGGAALTQPQTVSADGQNLIVSSWLENKVQVWDPAQHRVLLEVPTFALPANAIRFDGDLIVAEILTGSVVRADGDDPSIRQTLISGLGLPAGLAATDDDLWVADWATGDVWQVISDGTTLAAPVRVAGALLGPEGMAVDDQENLLVVEAAAGRLLRVHHGSGQVEVVADHLDLGVEALPGFVPTWFFNGVTVAPDQTIYVAGDRGRVVYRVGHDAASTHPSQACGAGHGGHGHGHGGHGHGSHHHP